MSIYRIVRRNASAQPWLPSQLADLRCWLDASDTTTLFDAATGGSLPAADGAIGRWEDKTANNCDAEDAVNTSNVKITTKRPTRITSAQNGLDAVGFSGSQWFDHNSSKAILRSRSHALMVVVMKFGSISNSAYQFVWSHREQAGNPRKARFQFAHLDSNQFGGDSIRLDDGTTFSSVYTSTNPPYNTSWHVHVFSCDWGTGDFAYYVDGSQIGSTQTYAGTAGNTSDTDMASASNTWTAIGNTNRDGSDSDFPLSSGSRIGEIICAAKSTGSYSTSDREKLEGYLAHKWGLAANLPAGHPYKNYAPTA